MNGPKIEAVSEASRFALFKGVQTETVRLHSDASSTRHEG